MISPCYLWKAAIDKTSISDSKEKRPKKKQLKNKRKPSPFIKNFVYMLVYPKRKIKLAKLMPFTNGKIMMIIRKINRNYSICCMLCDEEVTEEIAKPKLQRFLLSSISHDLTRVGKNFYVKCEGGGNKVYRKLRKIKVSIYFAIKRS